MSGKNHKYNKPVKKMAQRVAKPVSQVKVSLNPDYPSWLNYALLGGILLLTFWCYHLTLSNQFTNWDDGLYIYENPYIKNLSANLHKILFTAAGIAYYHPLTMLSLALNWCYSGMSPESYYATDIILHLLNTVLVFFLSQEILNAMVKKGYGKIKGIPYLAGLCALLHGIHPMHVESVSWIAERKDVLYLFFYLLGIIMYVRFIMDGKIMQMVWVVLFFVLALASKPLAVVFPLSLLAIDVLLKRDKLFNPDKKNKFVNLLVIFWKLLINKIPFFIVSLVFGVITFKLQKEGGSITSSTVFTTIQRISFVGVNYIMYLWKLFVPFHLSSYYPYPELTSSDGLPFYFYFGPLAALVITVSLLYLAYKKGENYFRVALFGFAFYFFNVMFILQFVSAGPAIMADRYSYASYVGFVFMLVYFVYVLIDKMPAYKNLVIGVVAVFSCMLAYLCEARTEVWHNTKTLWEDVIKKYPAKIDTVYNANRSQYVVHIHPGVETAYKNLGNYYVQDKNPPDYDSAYLSYVVLEETKSKDAGVYSNLGNIWAIRGNIKKSLAEYTQSLSLNNKSFDTYLDRAITYSRLGQNDLAMQDYNHAYMLDSNNQKLLENRSYSLLNGVKNYKAAWAYYDRLINIESTNMEYYKNRGLAKLNSGFPKDALEDFNKVMNANPKDGACLYYSSFAYKELKAFSTAVEYAGKALQLGYKLPAGYLEGLQQSAKANGQ